MKMFNVTNWLSAGLIVILSTVTPVQAAPDVPRSGEIGAIRAEFTNIGDQAFHAFWSRHETEATSLGVSADSIRRMMYWLAPAYALGVCKAYIAPSDHADWVKTGKRIAAAMPENASDFTTEIQSLAADLMQQGSADAKVSDVSRKASYESCKTELEAVKQFLLSI